MIKGKRVLVKRTIKRVVNGKIVFQERPLNYKTNKTNTNQASLKAGVRRGQGLRLEYKRWKYLIPSRVNSNDPRLLQIARNQLASEKRSGLKARTGLFGNPLLPNPIVIGQTRIPHKKQQHKAVIRKNSAFIKKRLTPEQQAEALRLEKQMQTLLREREEIKRRKNMEIANALSN